MEQTSSELLRIYASFIKEDVEIDQSKVKGEAGTGYEASDGKGPFECKNCHYSKDGYCTQEIMMELSENERNEKGWVKIDPHGCCEYVDRIGGE